MKISNTLQKKLQVNTLALLHCFEIRGNKSFVLKDRETSVRFIKINHKFQYRNRSDRMKNQIQDQVQQILVDSGLMNSWVTETLRVGNQRPNKKQEIHSGKDYQILLESLQKEKPSFSHVSDRIFPKFHAIVFFFSGMKNYFSQAVRLYVDWILWSRMFHLTSLPYGTAIIYLKFFWKHQEMICFINIILIHLEWKREIFVF